MRSRYASSLLVGLGVTIGVLVSGYPAHAANLPASATNPKEHLNYWKTRYGELTPADDRRAKRAHEIFRRVLRAAGTRPGVDPRLLITQRDPLGISLPIAIPDGSIIMSPKTLALCYREPKWGDDRLAFVLGHEIAHQLKGDFWHMKFFQALEASKPESHDPVTLKWFRQVLHRFTEARVPQADEYGTIYAAQELQADDYGILYAAIAGYNTRAIVTEDTEVNFFTDWIQALAPHSLGAENRSPLRPAKRAQAVVSCLRTILDQGDVYDWGLRFYQASDYANAILAFRNFQKIFPSPEVYHNRALSHHQLALQQMCMATDNGPDIPFKLTLVIDSQTRASTISLLSEQRHATEGHMDQAITYYQRAIDRDPTYGLTYNNLGVALLQRREVYKAIATLQDALAMMPNSPQVRNHLGVAFYHADQPERAKSYLTEAHHLAPAYGAPLFNLGAITYRQQRTAEAEAYWKQYLALDAKGPWADIVRHPQASARPCDPAPAYVMTEEHIMGLRVEARESEVPPTWGEPTKVSMLQLQTDPFKVARYSHGVSTLSYLGEIHMIATLKGFTGASRHGIGVGSPSATLRQRYGAPSRILHMAQGENWVYDAQGIIFELQHGQVRSWLLY